MTVPTATVLLVIGYVYMRCANVRCMMWNKAHSAQTSWWHETATNIPNNVMIWRLPVHVLSARRLGGREGAERERVTTAGTNIITVA